MLYRLVALPVGDSRCPAAIEHDISQLGEAPIAIVLASTMGDFTYTDNADMHYMYGSANGNGRAALRIYHAQFPDRRMIT
ncbi:hypothetical protein TNCV_744531 [Trichonephila clavipes]|nr:hypothetical protein TNCV_744531 [Trichonephila clavipes]